MPLFYFLAYNKVSFMTDSASPSVCIHEDVIVRGKRLEITYIAAEPAQELADIIAFLIEIGLSQAERMPEVLQIIEDILRRDERFKGTAAEIKIYRETVFSRSIPFTMIEARAILSKLRKWQNAIQRRLEDGM